LAHSLYAGYRIPGEWVNLQMRTYYLTSEENGAERASLRQDNEKRVI